MADKPRVLVIERETPGAPSARQRLAGTHDVVVARSMARALALLREQPFSGVYVDSAQLSAVRWAGLLLQSDEILDAIADGVAVVDPELKVLWVNPEFRRLADPVIEPVGLGFYRAFGNPEVVGVEPCPFATAAETGKPAGTVLRIDAHHYLRVTVTPVADPPGTIVHLIAQVRDITLEVQQEQKINAIHKAGEELADLTPEELSEMGVEERTDLLKYNIARHMKDLLGLDFIEIRLLERATGRLVPLLTEGMTPLAARRELFSRKEGNGVTGFVAATGQSYLCPDTAHDPLYLEGAAGARSSLTVPLIYHGTVIGTLNVENGSPGAFNARDQQFLEIYARNVASALNTLELLQAEKLSTATASVEAISRELALPLDDILSDATTVLDRYAGHDEDIIARLRHLLYRAREIRRLIQEIGSTIVPEATTAPPKPPRSSPTPASWSSTPTRPSGARPTACSGARGRPSRPRATPTRPSRWRGRPLLRRPGRHPPARPQRLRSLPAPPRRPADRPHHPHDGLRLRPDAFDREGEAGGPANRPVQALPRRPIDGSRRASPPPPGATDDDAGTLPRARPRRRRRLLSRDACPPSPEEIPRCSRPASSPPPRSSGISRSWSSRPTSRTGWG